jgi:hypothetical protein
VSYSELQIKSDIKEYIQKGGGGYRAWYVGISKDARARLFNDHDVQENNGWRIYRQAENSTAAREVESYFVNTLGTDGGPGGGDQKADYVYAYKKTSHTNP